MVDEELLRPSREYMAKLDAQIRQMQADTAEKVRHFGGDDDEYVKRTWREFYRAVEPMRRERDAIGQVIANYYALQTTTPPVIVPKPNTRT